MYLTGQPHHHRSGHPGKETRSGLGTLKAWFTIAVFAHLGAGVVAYICPQTDILWEPSGQRIIGWTVGLERRALLLRVVNLVRTAAVGIVLVVKRGPQALSLRSRRGNGLGFENFFFGHED